MVDQNHTKREFSAPLWTGQQLNQILVEAGELIEPVDPSIELTGLQVDSRLIEPGDIFVALAGDPGDRFKPSARSDRDGHDFIAAAAAKGAGLAIVQQVLEASCPRLQVKDTYNALWALGRAAGNRLAGAKIAVTGSSGKTTAKSMLHASLGGYAAPGSFNNHIGVPLSLINAPLSNAPAIFEIGTSHPGEIAPLAAMVKPDVAVVLNVGTAHLENFPNRNALYEEKISIFNVLEDKSNAVWECTLELEHGLSFGEKAGADVRLLDLAGDLAEISVCGTVHQARVPGGGRHRAWTLCAALACCQALALDLTPALNLTHEVVPRGRGDVEQIGEIAIVDDSYNANPDSMAQAISAFLGRPDAHKILILGEMLELGAHSEMAHRQIALSVAQEQVYLVGEGFRKIALELGLSWYAEAGDALQDDLLQALQGPAALLLKGSNRVFWQHQFSARIKAELTTIKT